MSTRGASSVKVCRIWLWFGSWRDGHVNIVIGCQGSVFFFVSAISVCWRGRDRGVILPTFHVVSAWWSRVVDVCCCGIAWRTREELLLPNLSRSVVLGASLDGDFRMM